MNRSFGVDNFLGAPKNISWLYVHFAYCDEYVSFYLQKTCMVGFVLYTKILIFTFYMLCMEPHFVCSLYAGVLFFVGGGYFFNPQAPTHIPHYVIKTNKASPNHVAFGRDILFKFP